MVKQKSLAELRREIAGEKKKASKLSERKALEIELRVLREGPKSKFFKRLGRGATVLVKKGAEATGKGIVRARKFAEENKADQGLNMRRKKVRRNNQLNRRDQLFGNLDF